MFWVFLSCRPCGEETPCSVASGNYYAVASTQEIERIWIFFHGWNGSPQQYLEQNYIEKEVEEHNVLLLLPEGLSQTWSVRNMGGEDSHRDEMAFVQQILIDVEQQRGSDAQPIFLGGFSLGASLSETLACDDVLNIAGLYPISGGFWNPLPVGCSDASFPIRHVHGLHDTVWPYEGRQVGSGRQASQDAVQEFWTSEYDCSDDVVQEEQSDSSCISWLGCRHPLSWCLHQEGNIRTEGWFSRMIDFSLP